MKLCWSNIFGIVRRFGIDFCLINDLYAPMVRMDDEMTVLNDDVQLLFDHGEEELLVLLILLYALLLLLRCSV